MKFSITKRTEPEFKKKKSSKKEIILFFFFKYRSNLFTFFRLSFLHESIRVYRFERNSRHLEGLLFKFFLFENDFGVQHAIREAK